MIGALLAAQMSAAPFLAVGDNAELFLTGSISVKIDDNIYLNPANRALSDTVWTYTPGVDLVFGKGSATQGNVYYRQDIVRYSDNRNQNTELNSVGLNSRYDGGKSKFDLAASFAELAQNDNNANLLGDIVDRTSTHFHAKPEVGLTEKTSIGFGIAYDKTDYGPASFSDLATWSVPVDLYFEYSAKSQLSLGYRYRDNTLNGAGVDSQDHFLNIGARGEFTPKLSGQVRIGYNTRDLASGTDDSGLGVEGNLTYAISDKTSASFNVANDFSNGGTGEETKKLSWGLSANSKISEQLSVNGGVTYMATEYPTRTDTFLESTVGLAYSYDQMINFGANYTYRNNYAGRGGSDFVDNVFSFSANLRY